MRRVLPMSEEVTEPSYQSGHIEITRVMTAEDDLVYVSWDDQTSLLELLGLVEYARNSILNAYMHDDEDEEDE